MRDRIDDLTQHFMKHGVADPLLAQHKAIAAIGALVRRQALILGFSDTFAVIGIVLAIATVALLFAKKVQVGGSAGGGAY